MAFKKKAIASDVRDYLREGRTLKEMEQSLGKSLFGYVSREDEYMNLYSQSLYSGVNRDLRSPSGKPDLQISASAIQDTLATMPNYDGVAYRGISVPSLEEALNKFGIFKGAIYSDPAFTSYSQDLEVAKDFAKKSISNRDRIIFTTSSRSGSLMGSYAQYGAEKEILFPAGFPQKVKSVDVRKEGFSNVAYVELQDTPESVKFAKDLGLSDKKKAIKEAIASPENASQILRDELSVQPKNFISKQKKNFGGEISLRENASNFEFGQKFIAPKTGEILSLSAINDDGSVVLQDRKGANLEVSLKDFGKYKVKPSPNLGDLKAGDGLVKIASATDVYRDPVVGDRFTVQSANEDVVRGYTDTGDYTVLKRSQIPELFRPNTLGFVTYPALTSTFLGTAGIVGGATAGKLLAKSLGANEDQQNIAAGVGGVLGGLTGITTGYIGDGATMPTSFQDMAKRAMGVKSNSEAGMVTPNKKINTGSMAEQLSMFEPPKRKSGLLYLPKYLTIADQKDLLNDLRTVVKQAPLFTPTMSSGSPFRYKMTNIGDLGWVSDRKGYRYESRHPVTGQPYPEIPSSLRSMIADLSSKFGEQIRPDAVLLNWYPDGAKLGLHVDNTEKVSKPVVSLSLGDRGVFAIDTTGSRDRSTAMKSLERINVNSGDAIVFGGDLRNAYHAVERIDAGTAPSELGMKNSGRINLTARQVNKISSGGFGNPIAKFAKGFAMREGARLLAKQLGADEDQQQAVADTVTVANVAASFADNSRVNNMAANKKINTGSVSSSVKEPKSPKLTTDTLYKYLQMMGGDPVIVKPDGSQYNPDRKGRVNVGDRMTTAEKFGQAADVGLNNEFTKLPEIHARFDDPKIASMVAKELATGELTVGMQRNPETGEIETITKKFQPIPSRGNTQLRQYSLGNDPTGRYLAFNKPEEAYKAPPSLKELQADLRKSYKAFDLKPDATLREVAAAVQPRLNEVKNSPELRDRLQTVLSDIQNRTVPEQVTQQAIAVEPTPRSKTQLALESDRIGGYDITHADKIEKFIQNDENYRAVLGALNYADQDKFNLHIENLDNGDRTAIKEIIPYLNKARQNTPSFGGNVYDDHARLAFAELDQSIGKQFGFNNVLQRSLPEFVNSGDSKLRVDIGGQAKIEISRTRVNGRDAFKVDNIVAYDPQAVGNRFAMKTLKYLNENLPNPVVMGNVVNPKFRSIFEKQGYTEVNGDYLPPELAPQKQAIAQSPQQTLDTPSDAWKFPQQNERRLPNFYPQMASGENPLGTGATVQSTYDRAKSAYEGYQDFGYVPRDREFPTLREMKKLAESEGVKGDEAIKAYIKGKQNAPLIEAGVITPPELPMTARLGQEYISPRTGKIGTVESVGKKGVKLNVDGQAIPIEYQTLEKLKYTGNKDYGFVVPAALRPVFGGFAGGTLGAIAFKQLAKAAGLNEDQQNIAAGVGGVTGAITGGSLSLFKPTTELKAPTARQFAQSVMGIPAPSESGMFHSESGMVMMGDRPQTLSELQAARRELDAKYPDSPRYDRTAKPEPRKPVPFLTFDQAADQMSMSSSEYRAFQDRVYAEQKAVQSKPYQERQNQIAKQKFQQEQSYFDALKAWNKAGDPTIPMPRKEDFVSPIKNTFDFERTLSEASMAARSAESQAKGFGKPQPKSAIAQATQAIKNAGEIVLDALYQPSAANPSRASSPKQSNFIAESEVQKTAAAMGVSGARVRAEIASQRASGEAPNLSKATEAIATRTQPKELAPRSLKQMQQTAQQYTFNPPISEPVSTRAKTPTWELPAADFVPLPIPNKVDPRVASAKAIGDRVIQPFVSPIDGVAGRIGDRAIKTFGVSADVGQALEAFNRSASKGENASMAATRAAVSVGSFYGTSAAVEAGATALASRSAIAAKFLPPPVRLAAVLGLSIAASTGADKAISKIAGVDEQKQAKYGKDMLKLGLDVNPDSELYQPFGNAEPDQARDLSKVGEYARAYANSFVNTLAIVPQQAPALGRSLANLANSQSIENARYQSERQTSLQAGMDAKAKKSIAYEKRDDGTEVGYLRNRGYNATESRVLALQNLANEHGYEVPRTGKFEAKTLDALEKLGYSQSQISAYIQGKTDVIGKPNQVTPDKVAAVKVALARSRGEQVSSSELSAALSAERKAQGLKGGEMLNQGQVDRVFQSLAGRSLSQLRQSAKVGGNKTQSALRMGAGLR